MDRSHRILASMRIGACGSGHTALGRTVASSVFCFLLTSLPTICTGDMIAPGYASRSIDFTSRYVFIGTNHGVSVFDKKTETWDAIALYLSERSAILGDSPSVRILATKVDENDVWFGTYQKGLHKYNLMSDELSHYEAYRRVYNRETKEHEQVGNCDLLDDVVNSIAVDGRGDVWFAGNRGVSRLGPQGWENFLSRKDLSGREVKLDGNITCLDVDESGRIWAGRSDFHYAYYDASPPVEVVGGGVSVFDGETWIHYYAANYDLRDSDELHMKTDLISNDVMCIAMDNHKVWIGTTKGLSVYDLKTKKWKNYTTENSGIKSNRTASIAVGEDAIWVASDSGICRYDKVSDSWLNYGSDVLPNPYVSSVGYDKYEKTVWAVTGLYAYQDVYAYRFDGSEWSAFSTRKRLRPENEQEYLTLGKFLKGRRVRGEAKAVLGEIAQEYPNSKESIEARYEWLTTGEIDVEELRGFQRAHPRTPYATEAQGKIAGYYGEHRDYERAIKEYQAFIEMVEEPGRIQSARWYIALYYGHLGQFSKEIDVRRDMYRDATDRRTAGDIARRIGDVYKDGLKDYQSAIEWFERGGALDRIAVCYELLGDYQKALEMYRKVGKPRRKIIELESKLGIEREYSPAIIEADTSNGRDVWFGSEGGGLWRYDGSSGEWLSITSNDGLASNIIHRIVVTRKHVWVKTEHGLSRIRKTDNRVWNYGYSGDFAYDGRAVWIVAKGHFAKYDEDTDTDEEIGSDSLPVGSSILLDSEYAWTFGWHYVSGYNMKNQTWDKHGRSQYSLRFLASDMDFLWFANVDVFSAPQGISRFEKNKGEWTLYTRTHARKAVPTQVAVWFLGGRGIARYDRKTGEIEDYQLSRRSAIAEGLLVNDIALVGEDVWVGFPKGMARFNEKEGRWEEYYAPDNFSILNIHFLTVENENIWFRAETGSNFFNTSTKKWPSVPLGDIDDFSLTDDVLWWIWKGKIYRYDLKTRMKEEIPGPSVLGE